MCLQVYYAKFPPQIDKRQILLLHPVLGGPVPIPSYIWKGIVDRKGTWARRPLLIPDPFHTYMLPPPSFPTTSCFSGFLALFKFIFLVSSCLHPSFLSFLNPLSLSLFLIPPLPLSPESGATAKEALNILKEHGVREEKIHIISLFATPRGVHKLLKDYPKVTILTSEVHPCSPSHFGMTYFGSD